MEACASLYVEEELETCFDTVGGGLIGDLGGKIGGGTSTIGGVGRVV